LFACERTEISISTEILTRSSALLGTHAMSLAIAAYSFHPLVPLSGQSSTVRFSRRISMFSWSYFLRFSANSSSMTCLLRNTQLVSLLAVRTNGLPNPICWTLANPAAGSNGTLSERAWISFM
jgi:hypothetical protein